MSVISAGSAAVMSVVTEFGSKVVGGFSAARPLDSMIMLPSQSLGVAVNSMAGQNIGVQNWKRVHRITKFGLLYNMMIMISIGIIVFVFPLFFLIIFFDELK